MSESTRRGIVIIGGGPAGLAAAISAKEAGAKDVLLVERDVRLGGILNQCIHDGFGLHRFKEALSGPEYAARYTDMLRGMDIEVMLETIALDLSDDKTILLSSVGKLTEIKADAVVLAMGCRERPRGALAIPGHRPVGVFTAGAAQNLVNLENIMPGKKVCILGSGDIGLIMARRMTLEGAKVEAVFELLPYSSGLPRNIQQCLVDYDIPLYCSTTVVEIIGQRRLEGVKVAQVDDMRNPIPETERFVPCDTLLLSVGLIPENELAREAGIAMDPVTGGPKVDDRCMTSIPGIFSCGNALHVHDLVDWVSEESAWAGKQAAAYVIAETGCPAEGAAVSVIPGNGVRYVKPAQICKTTLSAGSDLTLSFRVFSPARGGTVVVLADGETIYKKKHARLHPAEMIHVPLSEDSMRKIAAGGSRALEVRVQ